MSLQGESSAVEAGTAFDEEQYARIYPPGIERHYWTRARNLIVEREIRRLGLASPRILEVGCGKGIVVRHLRRAGLDAMGVDLAPVDPLPEVRGAVLSGIDAVEAPAAVRERTEALLLLDVLEHLGEPGGFLRELLAAYPRVSRVVITVPARPEIWSGFDELNRHYRRYTRELLSMTLEAGGLRVLGSRHLFHVLYPAVRLLRALGRERSRGIRAPAPRAAALHGLVARLLALEDRIVPGSWAGTSIIASAEVVGGR